VFDKEHAIPGFDEAFRLRERTTTFCTVLSPNNFYQVLGQRKLENRTEDRINCINCVSFPLCVF
jgi:hypothetical protein